MPKTFVPTLPPSAHALPTPEWLGLVDEPILEPDLPIVDPHHHLWERVGNRYLLNDVLADVSSGHNVVSTVFMECRAMYRAGGDPEMAPLGETEFVNGIAAMSASGAYGPCRIAEGIIGFADLRLGSRVRRVLEAQMDVSGGRWRGIRYISAYHTDPSARGSSVSAPANLLAEPGFREGFAELGRMSMTFDAWMYHTQLEELYDLAKANPLTAIIIDHVGGALGIGPYAGKRDEVFKVWKASIDKLGKLPNVTIKLGGLGMKLCGFDFHERPKPPTSEELAKAWAPYFEACIAAFGPDRCMFESNFPVDKPSCSYHVMWNAFKRITASYSDAEKRALHGGTAARVYKLLPPS